MGMEASAATLPSRGNLTAAAREPPSPLTNDGLVAFTEGSLVGGCQDSKAAWSVIWVRHYATLVRCFALPTVF